MRARSLKPLEAARDEGGGPSSLPAPGVLAADIVEEIEAALAQFSELAASLPLDRPDDSA